MYIKNLSVSCDSTQVLSAIFLECKPGTIHALMGPNGSGKSSLAATLIGNPAYTVTNGSIKYKEQGILEKSPDMRARMGIFLAFQQPPALPGLRVFTLLYEMHRVLSAQPMEIAVFQEHVCELMAYVKLDRSFLHRSCNDGFSGGERKRLELLQILIAQPSFVILDEIDSGLDIDALVIVKDVVEYLQAKNPATTILCITHNPRLFKYIIPHEVHVLKKGRLVADSDVSLVHTIEQKGYDEFGS